MSDKSLEWVIVNSNGWGDMFIDYKNICLIERQVNVIFYGYDEYIPKLLEFQDNIEKVVHLVPESREKYARTPIESGSTVWVKKICEQVDVDPREVTWIHRSRTHKINRDIDIRLPPRDFKLEKPSLLFNPFSIQSVNLDNHCPLIPEVLPWLVEQGWNIVLTGQKVFDHVYYGPHPWPLPIENENEVNNLQNLVGKTESLIDVLHIANQCEGIISTSNCLAHWSIMTNKPAIILMNDYMTNPGDRKALKFYREWIEHEPNTLLPFDCTPQNFMEAFKKKGW